MTKRGNFGIIAKKKVIISADPSKISGNHQ
jgi:hypothetical protein